MKHSKFRLATLGNYAPRRCGIATFTTDLTSALALQAGVEVFAVAMNDDARYEYPERVRFSLNQEDLEDYRRAADFLNSSLLDAVLLQHEYGIFGGASGAHVLELLDRLRAPVVTTFHTILEHPSAEQLEVLTQVAAASARVVTMSAQGHEFLQTVYGVPARKIDFIHHGVPDVPFSEPRGKAAFGLAGRRVVLTFGLLSPNKGVETAICALPEVARAHPDVMYLVLGTTHPHVVKHSGEAYRESLRVLAHGLGVAENVRFDAEFVELSELVRYIDMADVYVTPYLNREQITSGTLAYALGLGKAVVSTPYWYAEELLGGGRGVIVPFKDSAALAETLTSLLGDDARRDALRRRAYAYGRTMVWSEGARHYLQSAARAAEAEVAAAAPTGLATRSSLGGGPAAKGPLRSISVPSVAVSKGFASRQPRVRSYPVGASTSPAFDLPAFDLPAFDLRHVATLTDTTGIVQHATYTVPNLHEGYTTDDNARALMVSVQAQALGLAGTETLNGLSHRYLAFLNYAFDPATKRYRNFMSFERRWLERVGAENAHARALRALATVRRRSAEPGLVGTAERLFGESVGPALDFTSPRAWALTLLALAELPPEALNPDLTALGEALLARLLRLYDKNTSADWPWFEDHLCYSNAKLPHGVIAFGTVLGDEAAVTVGIRALKWLAEVQTAPEGHFAPVGSDRVYRPGDAKPHFDQQPVEAYASVAAYLAAYQGARDERWLTEAQRALAWFFGRNVSGLTLHDAATGGCRDGLHHDRLNQNEGAESTLSLWLAVLEYHQVTADLTSQKVAAENPTAETVVSKTGASKTGALEPR